MKMYQVDAFTTTLFKGNPAAVLIDQDWLSETRMQQIANENNLSETAFVKILDAENYEIRWFTPTAEVDFCGHATLAASFCVFRDYTEAKTIHFHVRQLGIFIVTLAEDGKITMNFPVRPARQITEYPALLRQALTKPFKRVYLNTQAYIVEYESVQDVLDETPDLELLKQLGQLRTAITADNSSVDVELTAQDSHYDCVSRYFAPSMGIPEDPVTGSIHTAIAPLWAERLAKQTIVAYQASERGGVLHCQMQGERIEISGYARLYMIATLFLDEC